MANKPQALYTEYFGLREAPFKITPMTEFFYGGGQRGEILHALLYAISAGEGIMAVTGEVGSGKTMLLRTLIDKLPDNIDIVYIANPSLSGREILYSICEELNLKVSENRSDTVRLLQNYLVKQYSGGRRVVAFIDEAQAMPEESLEEIRLISNLETSSEKLLQIVMFGQQELYDKLQQQNMRQLRERVTVSLQLKPFGRDDVREYIATRLRAAGYRGGQMFSNEACRVISSISQGLSRRINVLADKAMLSAYERNSLTINEKDVRRASRDVNFGRMVYRSQQSRKVSKPLVFGITAAVLCLLLLALGLRWSQTAAGQLWVERAVAALQINHTPPAEEKTAQAEPALNGQTPQTPRNPRASSSGRGRAAASNGPPPLSLPPLSQSPAELNTPTHQPAAVNAWETIPQQSPQSSNVEVRTITPQAQVVIQTISVENSPPDAIAAIAAAASDPGIPGAPAATDAALAAAAAVPPINPEVIVKTVSRPVVVIKTVNVAEPAQVIVKTVNVESPPQVVVKTVSVDKPPQVIVKTINVERPPVVVIQTVVRVVAVTTQVPVRVQQPFVAQVQQRQAPAAAGGDADTQARSQNLIETITTMNQERGRFSAEELAAQIAANAESHAEQAPRQQPPRRERQAALAPTSQNKKWDWMPPDSYLRNRLNATQKVFEDPRTNGRSYTARLITVGHDRYDFIEKFLRYFSDFYPISNAMVYPMRLQSGEKFVVTFGLYASRADAELFLKNLPPFFSGSSPFAQELSISIDEARGKWRS